MPNKRKRSVEPPSTEKGTKSSPQRRPTRQTPVYPPPIPVSPKAIVKATPVPLPIVPGLTSPVQLQKPPAVNNTNNAATPQKRGRGRPRLSKGPASPSSGRRMSGVDTTGVGLGIFGKENLRPGDLAAPELAYQVPLPAQQLNKQSLHPSQRSPATRVDKMTPIAANAAVQSPKPTATATPTKKSKATTERPSLNGDRNIDMVVLGNLCFKTWYPSYYGKELLGDTSGSISRGSKADEPKTGGYQKKEKETVMLDRLYVCPHCFKYAKEIVTWWGHLRACQQRGKIPGTKVYTHPRGIRKVLVAHDGKAPGPKKRRGEGGAKYVEQVVKDEGEWSIWVVDGEADGVSSLLFTFYDRCDTDR